MNKKTFFLLFILLLVFSFSLTASAQSYSFSLDAETVHVYWESDGTISLYYEFVFTNDPSAPPIEYVDVGMPTYYYNSSNASAKINGISIGHIAESTYVSNALELGLGSNSIQAGQTGTVTFQISDLEKEIYFDSEDDSYASAVFSPQYFDGSSVHGSTDLTVVFHLPPGVLSDQGRYHKAPNGFSEIPYTSLDSSNRVTYAWNNTDARGDKQYLFGASFPKSVLPEGIIRVPTLLERLGISEDDLIGYGMFFCIGLFFIGLPILVARSQKKRKMKYLPPMISLSSNGIKRGLTAIEAAILLEEPMDKILTMILFATLKKDAAEVTKKTPLTLDVKDPLPEKLRKYEVSFLEAMKIKSKAKRKTAIQKVMISLVKSVQNG